MSLAGAEKSYSKIFLVAAHVLVLLTLYSIYDETILRRPWKAYQENFNHFELQVAEQELAAVKAAYKKDGVDQKIADLQFEIEKVQTDKLSEEFATLQKQYTTSKTQFDDAEMAIKFKKSVLDSDYYFWKHAVLENHDAADILAKEKKYKDLEAEIHNLKKDLDVKKSERDALKAKIDDYDQKIADFTSQIEKLKQPLLDAEEKIDNIKTRSLQIQQVVLDYGKEVDGNIKWGRVDRCQTCHVGADKAGYEDVSKVWKLKIVKDETAKADLIAKKPELRDWVFTTAEKEKLQALYGTHPGRTELLKSHPIEQFGCTSCHGGDGRAVNIKGEPFGHGDKAHGFHHHSVEPLLLGDQMQSNCLSCHNGMVELKGAEQLSKGAELFTQLGCQNCHAAKGYENMFRVGPELNKVGAKVTKEWLVDWVKNPHNYMPKSRMPNFGLTDAQAVAVASYLEAHSESFTPRSYNLSAGSAANGEKIFNEVGCLACHSTKSDEAERGRGPNLSRLNSKIKDPNWLVDWIQNPKTYSEHARMPDLRLTEAQSIDVAAYLWSLSPDYKNELLKRSEALAKQVNPGDQSLLDQGKAVITQRGCYSCHLLKGFENGERIGPELTAEALKEAFEFDFGDALAPGFTFKSVEGKTVFVGHLDSNHEHEELNEKPGEKTQVILDRVKTVFADKAAKVDEVTNLESTWQSWIRNKLKYPLDIYKHERSDLKMPSFDLSPSELDALLVFLKAMQKREVLPAFNAMLKQKHKDVAAGQVLVAEKNCLGCHSVQGFGGDINPKIDAVQNGGEKLTQFYPPSLTHVGMKIRPEWLHDFLLAPSVYRPALNVRMPTFGFTDAQIGTLQGYFNGLDGVNSVLSSTDYHLDPALVSVGERLTQQDAFNCFSCHLMNGKTPGDDKRNWAPDWGNMRQRLQYGFIPLWIQNPVGYQDYAVMSAFLKSDAEVFPGYLDDKADAQLKALREYILSVGK